MNQFFSDSLSEKTKFRMAAGLKAGRWLWVAPLGYKNNTSTMAMESEPACLTPLRLAVARPRSRITRGSRLSSGSPNLKTLQGKAGSILQLRDSLPKMQLPLWRAALCWHELVAIEMFFDVQLNP
jgi:hypothetical protein